MHSTDGTPDDRRTAPSTGGPSASTSAGGPATSRLVRWLCYCWAGAVGSFLALAVGLVGWYVLRSGSVETAIVVAVLALVGLGLTLRGPGLAVLTEDPDLVPFLREFVAVAHPAGVVLASVLWAGVHVLAAVVHPFGPVVTVTCGLFVPGAAAQALSTRSAVDAAERVLTYDDRTVDLDRVRGVRRVDVRTRAVLWLSFPRGTTATVPRLVVVSRPVADRVEELAAVETPTGDGGDPTVRAVAYLVGLGCLLTAVGVYWAVSSRGGEQGLAVYLASFFLLFGALVVGFAVLEG